MRTIKRVELTIMLVLLFWFLIYKLKANAIAPLIVPLYHMSRIYFLLILSLKQLKTPIMSAGISTAAALATMQANKSERVNLML